MEKNVQKWVAIALKPLVTIVIAMIIGSLLILPSGTSPLEAYSVLLKGAFGSQSALFNTLMRTTPILFTGLAACVALKAGVFNIGTEGQLYMGAIAAALVASYCGFIPSILLIPACLLAAGLAGIAWSFIPALLKDKYGINLIITSIMMNNLAVLFTTYLASYVFMGDLPIPATPKIPEAAMLAKFSESSNLNVGFLLALAIAVGLYIIIYKTPYGYELRALGISERFTQYMGVNAKRKMYSIMFISAFIAALGGAEQTLGVNNMFISGFSPEYGFTGITVYLLGGKHPLGVIVSAIFFGALTNGAMQMEVMTNVSRDLIDTVQAVIIVMLAAEIVIQYKKKNKIVKA